MSRRIKPHKVRGRELEEVREKDPDGRIVYHHRTVDTLGKMLRAGTITQEMHDAAKDFQAAFIVAQLDPLRALPILRVPGTGREPQLSERQLHDEVRCTRRWRRWAGSAARRDRACGTWSGCKGACASGRCTWDGAGGRWSKRERGDPGRGARDVGGILRIRCGQARFLKMLMQLGRRLPDRRAEIGRGHRKRGS